MNAPVTAFAGLLLTTSTALYADSNLPLNELAFIDLVPTLSSTKVIELLGEPHVNIEVTDPRNGKVVGQIWRYEYLNTNEDGDYYKSTELNLVNGRVVNVTFSNSGSDDIEVAASPSECAPTC